MIASSKLYPFHGMNAASKSFPSASSPSATDIPSISTSPFLTLVPEVTTTFWLMLVPSLLRTKCSGSYVLEPSLYLTTTASAAALVTSPSASARIICPELRAAAPSIPVPTIGDEGWISGTACLCWLLPISERYT